MLQKVVCPKVSRGWNSAFLENLLESFWLAGQNVRTKLFTGQEEEVDPSWNKKGSFCPTFLCCDYVLSREVMEVLSATSPGWLPISRGGEHQLVTFMCLQSPTGEAVMCRQEGKELPGLPPASLASCSFCRSDQARRAGGHRLPSPSHEH